SKNPTVIQTAYWWVRTVVRFITRCNSSSRQEGCSRLSSSGELGSLGCPSPTLVSGAPAEPGKGFPGQMDHTRLGYPLLNAKALGVPLADTVTGGSAPGAGVGGECGPWVGGGVGSWLLRNESPGSPALLSTLASGS